MRYDEFVTNHPAIAALVTPATLRQWKKRDKVPNSAVTKAGGRDKMPEPPVTASESVTNVALAEAYPSRESGHPEWDIMADGYARGFPGDTNEMRARYRSEHAYRRIAEAEGWLRIEERFALDVRKR